MLIPHLQKRGRHNHHDRTPRTIHPTPPVIPPRPRPRPRTPLIYKATRLREDQNPHLSRGLEDIGNVLAARGFAVRGAGPGGEGRGERGGGGADGLVTLAEVGGVGGGGGPEVGAQDSPLGEGWVEAFWGGREGGRVSYGVGESVCIGEGGVECLPGFFCPGARANWGRVA